MTTPRAMAVNTIVVEVPMLNAAPPLRVSVIVSAPPRRTPARAARPGVAASMRSKPICAFSYARPVQGFEPLPAQVDLPALEHEVLTRWQNAGIFERSLKQTEGGPAWIFYEGPPTANGMPGAHHVEARTFKDLFPRFKTMQGFHAPR